MKEMENGRRKATAFEEDEEGGGKKYARLDTIKDCESFHNNDYDFSKDDDDTKYKNCIPTVDRALEQQISNLQAASEVEGASKNTADKKRKMVADVKGKNAVGIEGKRASEKIGIQDSVYTDFNIYAREQMPINKKSDSVNTKKFNGNYYEDTLVKKPQYVSFRPERDMKDPKFFVGLLFDTKKLF